MLPMLFVLAVAPSLTLLDSIKAPNCQAVELLDDGRWLSLDRRWANIAGDAADYVLELDVYGLAEKKTVTLKLPMKPLHEAAAELFVDGSALHPTRGKAVAPFELELMDYRPAAGEVAFLIKNKRAQKDGTWKRRWLWTVLSAEDGKVVRSHVLHEESGAKGDENLFHLQLEALAPGGSEGWFSSSLMVPSADRPGFAAHTVTISRVALATGATAWSQTLDLPVSNNKNRAGFRFAATSDFSALVLAEYSEASYEPLEPKAAAYVVWPATGRVQQLQIPYTPYALAFDAMGENLVLGSNQARKLVMYRLSDGKVMSELPTGEHLQQVFVLPGGSHSLVLYGGASAELRAWPALKPISKIGAKSLKLDGLCGDGARRTPDGQTIVFPRCDARGLATGDGVVVLGVK